MDNKKPLPINKDLKKYARNMRKSPTDEENKLGYKFLRDFRPRFHRQRIIGNYIVDFYCPKTMLIVEVDGVQHYENIEYDKKRTAYLESLGYKVIRADNFDVKNNFDMVGRKIYNECEARLKELNINVKYFGEIER